MWNCSRFCSHKKICRGTIDKYFMKTLVCQLWIKTGCLISSPETQFALPQRAANRPSLLSDAWMFTGAVEQDIVIIYWVTPPPPSIPQSRSWTGVWKKQPLQCWKAKQPGNKRTTLHIPLAGTAWERLSSLSFLKRSLKSIQSGTIRNLTLPNTPKWPNKAHLISS